MAVKDVVGRFGEDLAVATLEDAGWEVLARNWRCRMGELDVIAVDGDEAVFVEVKTRRGDGCGTALEAVTRAKLGRLRLLAGLWLATQTRTFAGARIDVMAVTMQRSGPPAVEHVRGVG